MALASRCSGGRWLTRRSSRVLLARVSGLASLRGWGQGIGCAAREGTLPRGLQRLRPTDVEAIPRLAGFLFHVPRCWRCSRLPPSPGSLLRPEHGCRHRPSCWPCHLDHRCRKADLGRRSGPLARHGVAAEVTRRYPMYAEGRERLLPAASSWISRPSENGPSSRSGNGAVVAPTLADAGAPGARRARSRVPTRPQGRERVHDRHCCRCTASGLGPGQQRERVSR